MGRFLLCYINSKNVVGGILEEVINVPLSKNVYLPTQPKIIISTVFSPFKSHMHRETEELQGTLAYFTGLSMPDFNCNEAFFTRNSKQFIMSSQIFS